MADCKRKTANLFDAATAYGDMYSDGVITGQGNAINDIKNKVTADMIGKTYTISITCLQNASKAFVAITINGTTYWRENELTANQRSSFQFTPVTENDLWYITYNNTGVYSYKDIMLNEGSTPLPYEPYGWVHSLRKLTTATDTFTTLPVVLYPTGTTATVGLKGNMSQQSGTTTVPSKSVTVSSLESGTNYALFPKADFPNAVVGDTINIVVSGTSYSQKVMKIDASYVYIENRTV